MEEDGDGPCNVTQTNQSPSVGKLQNVHQEECEPGAQLNASNQQRDTMQHLQSSVPDDYQSAALQSARNSKLSKVDSVDSGVGRTYSQLSQDAAELESPTAEFTLPPESVDTGSSSTQVSPTSTDTSHSDGEMDHDCDPMQTSQSPSKFVALLEQLTDQFKNLKLKAQRMQRMQSELLNSLSEFEALLEKVGKELTDQDGNLELQVEMAGRKVSSLNRSSIETSDSTPEQLSCTSSCLDSPETKLSVESQSQSYTRTAPKGRLYSDSQMIRHRKSENKRKQLVNVKPRPFSEVGSDGCT